MARALVALGSNLGDRAATLDAAVTSIAQLPGTRLAATSAWIESEPVGPPQQPAYLNGAVLVETSLEPLELLGRLHEIENTAGRTRTVRWGPRTLDLDVLLYDDAILETERLTLPHPRMALRRFVLEPANEIASAMVHRTTGLTIGALLARLQSTPPYLALMGPPGSGKTRLASEIAQRTGCRLLLDQPDQNLPGTASSAGPDLDREIEFLARRSQLTAINVQPADRWTLSDFWLAQSLAWAEVEQGDEVAWRLDAVYRQFAEQAMPARFVAMLDVDKSDRGSSSGSDKNDRLAAAMRSLVQRAGQPPVIWLSSSHWQGAVEELLAVLAG